MTEKAGRHLRSFALAAGSLIVLAAAIKVMIANAPGSPPPIYERVICTRVSDGVRAAVNEALWVDFPPSARMELVICTRPLGGMGTVAVRASMLERDLPQFRGNIHCYYESVHSGGNVPDAQAQDVAAADEIVLVEKFFPEGYDGGEVLDVIVSRACQERFIVTRARRAAPGDGESMVTLSALRMGAPEAAGLVYRAIAESKRRPGH